MWSLTQPLRQQGDDHADALHDAPGRQRRPAALQQDPVRHAVHMHHRRRCLLHRALRHARAVVRPPLRVDHRTRRHHGRRVELRAGGARDQRGRALLARGRLPRHVDFGQRGRRLLRKPLRPHECPHRRIHRLGRAPRKMVDHSASRRAVHVLRGPRARRPGQDLLRHMLGIRRLFRRRGRDSRDPWRGAITCRSIIFWRPSVCALCADSELSVCCACQGPVPCNAVQFSTAGCIDAGSAGGPFSPRAGGCIPPLECIERISKDHPIWTNRDCT